MSLFFHYLIDRYYTRKFVDLIWEFLNSKNEYRIDYDFRLKEYYKDTSTWGFDIKLKKYSDKEYYGLFYWDSTKSLYHLCNFEEVKKYIENGIKEYNDKNYAELKRYEYWHW